jgi:hypothetical protein
VFRQTTWDENGFAIRDPDSTTYTGAIETAVEFGKRIYQEALQRGWLGRLAESTRVQLASFDPPQAVMSFESSTMA